MMDVIQQRAEAKRIINDKLDSEGPVTLSREDAEQVIDTIDELFAEYMASESTLSRLAEKAMTGQILDVATETSRALSEAYDELWEARTDE